MNMHFCKMFTYDYTTGTGSMILNEFVLKDSHLLNNVT